MYLRDATAFAAFLGDRRPTLDAYEEWVSAEMASVKPQTVKRKAAAVRRLLAYLARHGDADATATLAMLAGGYQVLPKIREADIVPREEVTLQEFKAAVMIAPPWGKELMSLLWWTGARISEVVGDPVAGIDPITVAGAMSLAETGVLATRGKGGKVRHLILPTAGRASLAEWAEGIVYRGERGLFAWAKGSPLFTAARTWRVPASRQQVHDMLAKAVGKGAHCFRHSYKARLRRAGVDEEIRRALMGHSPAGVTERYGKVTVEEMAEAAESLEGIDS